MIRYLKIMAVIVSAGVIIGIGWIGYEIWDFERPALSLRQLGSLHPGMDTNAVARLLGRPTTCETFTNEQGQTSTERCYSRTSGWKFTAIFFGPDGHFDRYYED